MKIINTISFFAFSISCPLLAGSVKTDSGIKISCEVQAFKNDGSSVSAPTAEKIVTLPLPKSNDDSRESAVEVKIEGITFSGSLTRATTQVKPDVFQPIEFLNFTTGFGKPETQEFFSGSIMHIRAALDDAQAIDGLLNLDPTKSKTDLQSRGGQTVIALLPESQRPLVSIQATCYFYPKNFFPK
jgi:hypothetical protein